MIFNFHDSTDKTLLFVQSVLPLMENIRSFEVFRDQIDSPYFLKELINGKEYEIRLPFILTDEYKNELRLVTLCGYGGSSPHVTEHILQLFGIYTDYDITVEGVNHISQEILPDEIDLSLRISVMNGEPKEGPLYKARLNFTKPGHRLNFFNALETFGFLDPVHTPVEESKYYYKCAHDIAFSPKNTKISEDVSKLILNNLALGSKTKIEFYQ